MRILLEASTSRVGGARTYLVQLARAISRQESRDEWMLRVPEEMSSALELPADVRVLPVRETGGRGFYDLLGNWARWRRDRRRLQELVGELRPDVLFVASELGHPGLGLPQVLLVRNRIYYDAEWYRGMESWRKRLNIRLRRGLALRSMKAASHLVFPSRAMQEAVTSFLGLRTPSTVLHYGAPKTSPADRSVSGEVLRLLSVSSYYPQKNLAVLLDAVRILKDDGVPVLLTLTGDPASGEGRRAEADRVRVEALGDSVALRADLPHEETLALYADADVFVFPSTCESFGHPLLEAMVQGLPVAAADTAVDRELCEDRASYFEPADPRGLADLLARMRDGELPRVDPEDVARRFSWDAHLAGLTSLFRALLG